MSAPAAPGQRNTRQRAAVVAALDASADFASAQDVRDAVQAAGASVGLTTVYRTLAALAEAGDVDVLVGPDGESRYRMCTRTHHHHLVCRECGATVEISGAGVERWAASVAKEYGYADVAHTVEIFGLCPACAARD